MKVIMIMFDSLNRRFLPSYGNDFVYAPNFKRLSEKTVTFDKSFVGSMPCMPARRELHTGRLNFLHRSWGPIEPFDDSMPEILKNNGVVSHMVSDHYHYWEDGGATYHTRYSSWELVRGQEGDPWKCEINRFNHKKEKENTIGACNIQDYLNRTYMDSEEKQPQAVTFNLGLEFLQKNKEQDNWFLQIETFDPHEPFYVQEHFLKYYNDEYKGKRFDAPPYDKVKETTEEQKHVRNLYFALLSMCDKYVGKVLDFMDEHNMWEDTMLIVNTDHGFILNEHGYWGKSHTPYYNEVANTPLFVWDPRLKVKNERRNSVVQTIDIAPTLLDFFNVEIPKDMLGKPLYDVIKNDTPTREYALFGMFGGQVNITDGKYVYMRSPSNEDNQPLNEYTLMPTMHGRGRSFISCERLSTAELHEGFTFTKGCPQLKIKSLGNGNARKQVKFETLLYDIENDPNQLNPIKDEKVEQRMIENMIKLMEENDCPSEQFIRMGLK